MDIQYNERKKTKQSIKKHLQNTMQKTKPRATRTPPKTRG